MSVTMPVSRPTTVAPVAIRAARQRSADRSWTVRVLIVANAAVTLGLWVRHGGMHAIGDAGGLLTAVGQVAGLAGTFAVLLQLLLMSRIDWLERDIGFDRLAVWHRWNGFATVVLLSAHAVAITLGYAAANRLSVGGQAGDFLRHYPDVLMSVVGLAVFLAVGITSVRALRRRLRRETWYAVHLYAYVAVALSFAHQLAVGTDFVTDPVARAWWVALYAAVAGAIVWWRVGRPIAFNARHRLRVHTVRDEAAGVVSVYLTGRHLGDVDVHAGQFFLWRFGPGTAWLKAHPYSLSAAPNGKYLRITVKALGDDSARVRALRRGDRAFAEGPYGAFTAARRARPRAVLIAGGIGITPIRALIESMPARSGELTLIYRAATNDDVAFGPELETLAERRGIVLHVLVGTDIGDDVTDQLGVPALRRLVPDLATSDVFLCGPPAMVDAVRRRLGKLRVPPDRIHFERFAY